jgi:hypothetical protein
MHHGQFLSKWLLTPYCIPSAIQSGSREGEQFRISRCMNFVDFMFRTFVGRLLSESNAALSTEMNPLYARAKFICGYLGKQTESR